MPLAAQDAGSGYIGSSACRDCHRARFESQEKSGHAHALRRAQPTDPGPGSRAQWAFGAGAKAITWVTQTGEETFAEHGRTYYTATNSLGVTPGHQTSADLVYRTFDPVATVLRCFRCHSTGPIALASDFQVQPREPGVHCESCHGPGRAHVESGGTARISNPKRLTAVQINTLCGACHRQASDLDDDRDWSNAWNVRHEPSYLHRAACFRNSDGALSCVTCHDLHQPLGTRVAAYDAKCVSCHAQATHTTPIASRSCIGCHMPQVAIGANLKFTNHWIGIYDAGGPHLIPAKRVVKELRPAPVEAGDAAVSTLIPVYGAALAERERLSGPNDPKVARAASDLGMFLLQIGKIAEAEAPLRRALAIDAHDSDREALAISLAAQGKNQEALELFRRATEGNDSGVAARSYVKIAELEPERADVYYSKAVDLEEKASGAGSQRVAVLLREYALELRARKRDREAEPLLRRALSIQQGLAKTDPRVTIEILNALGNLLEGRRQLDEAEKLERAAFALSEQKFGPESTELAKTCTNLADVLWNKKNLREAGQLYRRAISIDAALYGLDQPETAADIANLGMLLNEAGQRDAGEALLRKALAIYENTLGPNSEEARLVRGQLGR